MNYLGRCKEKGCDYALFATAEDVKAVGNFREVVAGRGAFRVGNNGVFGRCTNGHKFFVLKSVQGTYSAVHKCDSRCLNARGHDCTCSCGGANHGRGHAVVISQVTHETGEVTPGVPRPEGDVTYYVPAPGEVSIARPERIHLGEIGKNIRGTATVTDKRLMDSDIVLYTFMTETGNAVIKWFAPDYADPGFEVGEVVTFRAKVKRHDDHERFGKATIVTYLEEVE